MRRYVFLVLAIAMILPAMTACSASQTTNPTTAATAVTREAAAATPEPTIQATVQPTPIADPPPAGAEHTTILLMGAGEADFTLTDQNPFALTHILITLDPGNRVVKFTTLPYNLAVTAYRDGEALEVTSLQFVCSTLGPEGAVETIERNFGIDIDHWIIMNMMGVVDIVDALRGVEIDVDRMSINTSAEYLLPILGLVWEEVKSLGSQVLSGVQTVGFFLDTFPDDTDNYLYEEELLFRDRHPKILNAVIAAIQLSGLTAEDLVTIAENTDGRYITDIEPVNWNLLAENFLYCARNPSQYLHVPEVIEVQEIQGAMQSDRCIVFDEEKDVESAVAFVGEK